MPIRAAARLDGRLQEDSCGWITDQASSVWLDVFLHLDGEWVFDQDLEAAVTKAGLQRSAQF